MSHAGNLSLAESDPELLALIREEKKRQVYGIELIASEVRVAGGGSHLPSRCDT